MTHYGEGPAGTTLHIGERDAGRCLNPAHLHGPSAPVTECRTPDPYGQRRTIDLAVPGAARSGCRPLGCACAGGLGYCSGDS